jgi:FAD-linked oxidoreductase
MSWSNWSGSVTAPAQIARPQSEDELAALVRSAHKLRVTGAGHSFMPLCESGELIVSLDDMAGELQVAADRQTARIPAGWSIRRLTAALWDQGLALANQGDVNPQSLAGAMATGTHGTGADLGSLATFARGFRLIGADGEAHWCDAATNPDLYQAQRLSLGLFGVATEIDVAVVPTFHLAERIEKRRWADIRESYDELTRQHRHVEFWFFPHSDDVILKTLDPCDPCDPPPTTTDMEEASFRRILNIAARLPFLTPSLQRLMMKSRISGRRRGPAHLVFPSDRTIRFEEMEYEMPRAAGLDTLAEVVGWIRRKRLPVTFPFEFRAVAADDIWMSPINAGPVAAISMHQYAKMPWRNLFAEAEAIFRGAGGRPHWAKRHTLTRADVAALYPMAGRYNAVRRAADPGGKFLNPHLESLFA